MCNIHLELKDDLWNTLNVPLLDNKSIIKLIPAFWYHITLMNLLLNYTRNKFSSGNIRFRGQPAKCKVMFPETSGIYENKISTECGNIIQQKSYKNNTVSDNDSCRDIVSLPFSIHREVRISSRKITLKLVGIQRVAQGQPSRCLLIWVLKG